jgi:hypothetical protein
MKNVNRWIATETHRPKVPMRVDWMGPNGQPVIGGTYEPRSRTWAYPDGLMAQYEPRLWRQSNA